MKPRGFSFNLAREVDESGDAGQEAARLSLTHGSKHTANLSGMRAFEASLIGQAHKSTRDSNALANPHLRQVVPISEAKAIRGSQVTYAKDQTDLDLYKKLNVGATATNTSSAAPQTQLKFLELKRFVFQLEEIVEFSKDDAADVATLVKLLEQCLSQKLNLNIKNLDLPKMRSMLEDTVDKVKARLDVQGVDDPSLEENRARV